jgi:hypothetical protein
VTEGQALLAEPLSSSDEESLSSSDKEGRDQGVASSCLADQTSEHVNKKLRAPDPGHGQRCRSEQPAIVPRALASQESPHPRAHQEQLFKEIAHQWHSWVVVPERIAGVPTTMDMLDGGVFLPQKHCFWKNCDWTGDTNSDRWRHVRATHWTSSLATAVAYYHSDLHENIRLETVMNQVAGLLTRRGAPMCCTAIERRCLHRLWNAMEPSDSVQSIICFSCACSHPLVKTMRGNRISYVRWSFMGPSMKEEILL